MVSLVAVLHSSYGVSADLETLYTCPADSTHLVQGSTGSSTTGVLDDIWSLTSLVPLHGSSLPILPSSLWTVNITTYVMTILALVDNYLSWETQFTSFVIMYQLNGMLDGTTV